MGLGAPGTLDAEGFQARVQGGGVHAQQPGRSVVAGDAPVGSCQREEQVLALHPLELADRSDAPVLLPGRSCRRGSGARIDVGKHPIGIDPVTVGDDQGALDDVLQLAHVPRPVIGLQSSQAFIPERLDGTPHSLGKLPRERGCQHADVIAPFPQGWQRDRENIESVEEIFPKRPVLDRLR